MQINHSFVYIAGFGNYYKIGRSDAPEERIKELRVANPLIVLLAAIPCDDSIALEQSLHRTFHQFRFEGEWFFCPDVPALLRQLMQDHTKVDVERLSWPFLTQAEYEAFRDALPNWRDRLICMVLRNTGLRINEVLSIQVRQCRLEGVALKGHYAPKLIDLP